MRTKLNTESRKLKWIFAFSVLLSTWQFALAQVAPAITQQPADQAVALGSNATFTVSATGDPPLTYRWQLYGVDLSDGGGLSGAQTPLLTISNVLATDAGSYSVAITNAAGFTSSVPAYLTVASAPGIMIQPVGRSAV